MRQVRFLDPAGSVRTGEWMDDYVESAGRTYSYDEIETLPPVQPSKIICVGLNYPDHAEEIDLEVPDKPGLFLKGPNSVMGHNDTFPLPEDVDRVDYEAEFGAVIGKECRNVDANEALEYVAGFTCMNDISNRDAQMSGPMPGMDLFRGKAFDSSSPIGPVIASPDVVPDDAHIKLRVNGTMKQQATRSDQVFPIPELIEDISSHMTLQRDDVISMGTPAGVGPLQDGDIVEIEIEGVGVLRHKVSENI